MSLSSRTILTLTDTLVDPNAAPLSDPSDPLTISFNDSLADGTSADQADMLYHNQYTLAAAANQQLDLVGVLTDVFGTVQNFSRIKRLYVAVAAGSDAVCLVGGGTDGAGTNAVSSFLGAANDKIKVRTGGFLCLFSPDATAYAVVAGTADILRLEHDNSGSIAMTVDVVIVGASA